MTILPIHFYTYFGDSKVSCEVKYGCPYNGELLINNYFFLDNFRNCNLEDEMESYSTLYKPYELGYYHVVLENGIIVEFEKLK